MNFFKEQPDQDMENNRSLLTRGEQWLAEKKRNTADFLSVQMERLSSHGKKTVLLIFGVIFCGMTVFIVTKPFRANSGAAGIAPKPSEHTKAHIEDYPENVMSNGEYEMLVGFRKTIDSLRLHDPVTYQSLLSGRQGLIDSLDFLIKLYNNQGRPLLDH